MSGLYCKAHPHLNSSHHCTIYPFLFLIFQSFEELYGKDPSDKDRPSSKPSSNTEADSSHKAILKSQKVREMISCGECQKPRCVYATSKLTKEQEFLLRQTMESTIYTCGSILFFPMSPFHDTIVVIYIYRML